MKTKYHIAIYCVLGLVLAVTAIIGVLYGLRTKRAEARLENVYTQRLLEAQEHLQAISLKLAKAPIAGDAYTQTELLTGVSRQADGVVSALSALPLSHAAMGDTVKFCNQLSDYAFSLALSVAAGNSLTETQGQTLSQMEQQSTLLLGQLATAQGTMLTEGLRLTAMDSAFYQEAQLSTRPLEQVSDADNGMDYPSLIYDGAFSDARRYGTPKALGTSRLASTEAVTAARSFVGDERVREARSAADSGGVIECWGVTLDLYDGTVLNAEVTRQGGQMLWMVPEHASFTPSLSPEECAVKGQDFLKAHGYGAMEANHFQVYDGLAVVNYVAIQDGVLLYPDLIKLQIRMDTGEIVGVEANNYLMNHTRRTSLLPSISEQQALALGNPLLNARKARLCLIPYRDGETLCYELSGTYREHEYLVYLDAMTGAEVEILMIVDTDGGEMSAKENFEKAELLSGGQRVSPFGILTRAAGP